MQKNNPCMCPAAHKQYPAEAHTHTGGQGHSDCSPVLLDSVCPPLKLVTRNPDCGPAQPDCALRHHLCGTTDEQRDVTCFYICTMMMIPFSTGIVPVKLLPYKCNIVRAIKSLNDDGILPACPSAMALRHYPCRPSVQANQTNSERSKTLQVGTAGASSSSNEMNETRTQSATMTTMRTLRSRENQSNGQFKILESLRKTFEKANGRSGIVTVTIT